MKLSELSIADLVALHYYYTDKWKSAISSGSTSTIEECLKKVLKISNLLSQIDFTK